MKKNNFFLISIICIGFSSCGFLLNNQRTYYDEFKNTKTYTLKQIVRPTKFGSEISNATLTYERIVSESSETLNLYFIVARSTGSFRIEKKGFLKVNDIKFEIYPETEGTEYNTNQETNISTTTIKDSTTVKTQYNTDVKSYNWLTDKFIVRFTPEMTSSILKTDEITFRFYFGPTPATFIIKGANLKQVQKLLKNG